MTYLEMLSRNSPGESKKTTPFRQKSVSCDDLFRKITKFDLNFM